jgi:N-acyl-L-homoserine lactone synthetase
MIDRTFVIRTLQSLEELAESLRVRAEVFSYEKHWIDPVRLRDGLEFDDHDSDAIHGGAFVNGEMVGTFRLIQRGKLLLPVQGYYQIPPDEKPVELSRLAVKSKFRMSVGMIGLCRWIYGVAVDLGATHMYALQEFNQVTMLQGIGFPFEIKSKEKKVYKYSIDYVTVCPVDAVVPGLIEADLGRKRKYAPLFADPFDGVLNVSMLYPEIEKEVA